MTNPERYAVLHDVADELLDRLETEFQVDRSEGPEVDTRLAGGHPVDRVVRLTPSAGDGAPLTIGHSSFPGLWVRYGLYLANALPHCGCDACDEDPQRLADELTRRAAFLAEGRYKEEILPGDEMHYIFGGEFGGPFGTPPRGYEESRGGPINADYIAGAVTPARQDWGPWITR